MKLKASILFLSSVVLASAAMADVHFDISPVLSGGKIVTEGVTHASTINPFDGTDTSPTAHNYWAPSMRVFGYEMGEDPLFPRSAEDPGINRDHGSYLNESGGTVNLTGTGLASGSVLYFTVTGSLQKWNGSGYEPANVNSSLDITYGSTRTLTGSTGALSPLPIKTFNSTGDIHLHLDAELSASTPSGIYLMPAMLESSTSGVGASDPFWVVYNYGSTEVQHEAAIDYVQANYVPEPSAIGLLLLATPLLLRRRRHASSR